MKRLCSILFCLLFLFAGRPAAQATDTQATATEATAVDRSAPRLMVTDYSLDSGVLMPGAAGKLTVTLKNTNNKRAIVNLKLTLSDDSGDLIQNGMNTRFVNAVYAGGTYSLEAELTARHSAAVGRHSLTLTTEYEDEEFQSYSSSDTLYVDVRQTADLSFSGAELPAKIVEGDTVTVTLTLMNTGKAQLSNCKADFDIKGLLGGGTAFGGALAAGAGKPVTADLRAQSGARGATEPPPRSAQGKRSRSRGGRTLISKGSLAAARPSALPTVFSQQNKESRMNSGCKAQGITFRSPPKKGSFMFFL